MTATAAAGLTDVVAWLALGALVAADAHKSGRPWAVTQLFFLGFVVWTTAAFGLHPLFGAFVAGLTMPRGVDGASDPEVLRPLEEAGGLFLPLFFAVTGLSLNVKSLDVGAFLPLDLVCVPAMLGKLGPAYAGACLAGLDGETRQSSPRWSTPGA